MVCIKDLRNFVNPKKEKTFYRQGKPFSAELVNILRGSVLKSIGVFCGSSTGKDPLFSAEAARFGRAIAERDFELVYGGGNVGLMGILSSAVMERGGRVTGVIPADMSKEVPHREITRLIQVSTMHERKSAMYNLSDCFCVLPGGLGTLDEFFEVLTWFQLGLHNKPIALYNSGRFFDALIAFLNNLSSLGFVGREWLDNLIIADSPDLLFKEFDTYKPPVLESKHKHT